MHRLGGLTRSATKIYSMVPQKSQKIHRISNALIECCHDKVSMHLLILKGIKINQ